MHTHTGTRTHIVLPLQNLDATEIVLVNGMRVLMKHTTHMEDELFLTGVASGGLTEVRTPPSWNKNRHPVGSSPQAALPFWWAWPLGGGTQRCAHLLPSAQQIMHRLSLKAMPKCTLYKQRAQACGRRGLHMRLILPHF